MILIGLGPFRFSSPHGLNYNRLGRRFEYRWIPQMRIGRRPAEQFLGPGEEDLRIHGVLFPHAYGGYSQLNGMRDYAETGIPLPLASAQGYYFGPWCIRMIIDEQEFFHPNGDPRRVEFDMGLVAYGT